MQNLLSSLREPPPALRCSAGESRCSILGWLAAGLALVTGGFLRLWNLHHQLLLGDEFHAVRATLDWDLPRILTTYRLTDNSIPLTAFYRLLVESGAPLTEWVLRLPSVIAGLALLLALPWVAGRALGVRAALAVAWLAAISPSLVYYSRIARPYAVVTLLCLVAVVSFWRWWEGGGRWGYALVYCVAGAGAVWFHLGAGPLVASPLLFGAVDVARGFAGTSAQGLARLRRLLPWALLLVALIASFLAPASRTFLRLLRVRPGDGSPTFESTFGTLALQAGTGRPWLAILFWVAALTGLLLLFRDRRRLALYWVCAVGVQWAAIALLLQPTGVAHPIVLNRYLLAALPFVLLWTAYAVAHGTSFLERALFRGAGALASVAFVLVLLSGGPYASEPGLYFGSFAGSNEAMNFLVPPEELPADRVPAVYRVLAREPGREPVLEAPRDTAWWRNRSLQAFARVHGRRVVVGSDEPRLRDPRLQLRTVVSLEPERMVQSGARFVVVNLDPRGSTAGPPKPGRPARAPPAMVAKELARRLEGEWGEPDLVEGPLRVWDLSRRRWGSR